MIGAYVTVPPDQRFCQHFCDSRAGGLEVMVTLQQVAEQGRDSDCLATLLYFHDKIEDNNAMYIYYI